MIVSMCKYISVPYVDMNKLPIVFAHNGPIKNDYDNGYVIW